MKKLLTLLFAVALTFSLSAVSFAQEKPADKKEEKAEKQREHALKWWRENRANKEEVIQPVSSKGKKGQKL